MHSYIPEQPKRKAVSRLVFPPPSRAALHIARKYRLLPHVAATVADLAGLGERGAR